jgi:hypothetical protein
MLQRPLPPQQRLETLLSLIVDPKVNCAGRYRSGEVRPDAAPQPRHAARRIHVLQRIADPRAEHVTLARVADFLFVSFGLQTRLDHLERAGGKCAHHAACAARPEVHRGAQLAPVRRPLNFRALGLHAHPNEMRLLRLLSPTTQRHTRTTWRSQASGAKSSPVANVHAW